MKKIIIALLVLLIAIPASAIVIARFGRSRSTLGVTSLDPTNAFVSGGHLIRAYLYDDGTGTNVTDYTGNADGTLSGSGIWSTNGITIDAEDEYALMPISGITDEITIVMLYTATEDAGSQYAQFFADIDADGSFQIYRADSDTLIEARMDDVYFGAETIADGWVDGETHVVVMTAKSSTNTLRLYYDADLLTNSTSTFFSNPDWGASIVIGNESTGTYPLNGEVNAIYLFDAIFDSDDVTSITNNPYQFFINPPDRGGVPGGGPTPQTFYVAQTSAGTGDGTSYDNRMSVLSHNAGAFSPDDVIYVSGTITSTIIPPSSGTSGHPITYDGYYAGDCDPKNTYCPTSGGVLLYNATLMINLNDKDYIVYRDFTFAPLNGFESNDGRPTRAILEDSYDSVISGLEIRNCAFGRYGEAGVATFGEFQDFVFDNNYFYSDKAVGTGQNVTIAAAKRGRITNNLTEGGYTSWFMQIKSGTTEKIVSANNAFNNSKEEGYTMDSTPDARAYSPIWEYDVVASSTGTSVTLNNTGGEWTGVGDVYAAKGDAYMLFVDGTLAGRHALITGHNDAAFTLDTEGGLDFTDVSASDQIVIGYVYRKNYTAYNTATDTGNDGPFLQYGMVYEDLTEGNTVTKEYDSDIDIRAMWDIPLNDNSIVGYTSSCGLAPTGANLIKDNTVLSTSGSNIAGINVFTWDKNTCAYSPDTAYYSYYNTIIDNVVDDNSGGGALVNVTYQYFYASGNTESDLTPISPTGSNNTNHADWKVYWPYIDAAITIATNGTTVTVPISETPSLASYTTGDAWLENAAGTKVNLAYDSLSGDDIVFTAASTILTGATWYFWFNGADDSIEDSDGNDMPVYGFKPVTNNSTQ